MVQSNSKPQLQILDGGRSLPVSRMHRVLLEAYVTDTRLMGVLAIVANWSICAPEADRNDPDSWEELRQFIYIDCEEAGFETYQQVRGSDEEDEEEAERIENALVCGLGGREVQLDERELRLLLQEWARFNAEHDQPLSPEKAQYEFLLEPPVEADSQERAELLQKICSPLRSDEQVVNYFLMRCFGRDYDGARYLAGTDDLPLDLYGSYVCATFYRNLIDEARENSDGSVTYRCESLIEMNGAYETVISLVTVLALRVIGFEHCGRLSLTNTEAALILKKVEYITLYEVLLSDEDLEDNMDEFTLGFRTTMSEYKNGLLFMSYRPNNLHVDSREFLLSNDVQGTYFLSDGGQLLVCAHSLPDIRHMEKTITHSPLAPYLIPSGRFNFIPGHQRTPSGAIELAHPVMFQFMNSSCERFEDFLKLLRKE